MRVREGKMRAHELNNEFKYILKTLCFILFYIAFSTALMIVVLTDVIVNKNVIESGLTERIQILLIVGCGLLYAISAVKNEEFKKCNSLVGTLFSLFFIRELDAFFDKVFFHGARFYIVLEILLLSFLYFYQDWRKILSEFVEYTKTPRFVLLISGLVSLIFLSRLIGYKEIWKTLFLNIPADNIYDFRIHYRPFKNVAEEGVEVISYLTLFLSALNPFSSHKPKLAN